MKFVLAFFFALLAMAFAQVNFGNGYRPGPSRPNGGGGVNFVNNRPGGGGPSRPNGNGGYQPISIGPAYVQNQRPKPFANPLARGGGGK